MWSLSCRRLLLPSCTSRSLCPVRHNVRVRFAPSPTGFLHLGSIRTALFNFLFAKKHAGQFILRIEDTDQTRVVAGGLEGIVKELQWTGLVPDEGPGIGGPVGPYIQSERKHIYEEHVNRLIESDHAYRCFCSQLRLDLIRKEAARNREIPRYDNRCRHLTQKEVAEKMQANEPFTVRLKLTEGPVKFSDLVTGEECIDLSKVEADPIIFKSDGYPTYHLANVVDDHLMQVSHVLRGIEWQPSTPKHLMLFEAFGWQPPVYGHLPLILNSDGSKLSKRLDHIRLDNLRKQGYFPETIVNYLAGMGRGIDLPDDEKEIYSLPDLAERFEIERIGSHANRYDLLLMKALNRDCFKYLMIHDPDRLKTSLRKLLSEKYGPDFHPDDYLIDFVLIWSQDRIHFLNDLLDEYCFVWQQPELDFEVQTLGFSATDVLQKMIAHLRQCDTDLTTLKKFSEENGLKFSQLMAFLRLCLMGKCQGPPISEILQLLGTERFFSYLDRALEHCKSKEKE